MNCLQVTFADSASTAASIAFAHGASPGRWEKLGGMPLRSHGSSCLQHVIKLGAHTQVQRYLRITLHGLLHPPRDSSFHGRLRSSRCRGQYGVRPSRSLQPISEDTVRCSNEGGHHLLWMRLMPEQTRLLDGMV